MQRRSRNPAWLRDELILALDLYHKYEGSPPGVTSEEVLQLSALLADLGRLLERAKSPAYRNANGTYMKLMNFRRFDSRFLKAGKIGLSRGGKLEQEVWNNFSGDIGHLRATAQSITAAIRNSESSNLINEDSPDIQEAPEGRILTRVHRSRERSRKLVEAAKSRALRETGELKCEVCGFNFKKSYGVVGAGLIDVHHTRPVHTLSDDAVTKIEDLALLCSNCHRVIHSRRPWLTLDDLRSALRADDHA